MNTDRSTCLQFLLAAAEASFSEHAAALMQTLKRLTRGSGSALSGCSSKLVVKLVVKLLRACGGGVADS